MANAVTPDHDGHEDDLDGCDLEFGEDEATPDADLPPAAGGVQTLRQDIAGEDDVDSCNLKFEDADATTDAELPVTVGGVA